VQEAKDCSSITTTQPCGYVSHLQGQRKSPTKSNYSYTISIFKLLL